MSGSSGGLSLAASSTSMSGRHKAQVKTDGRVMQPRSLQRAGHRHEIDRRHRPAAEYLPAGFHGDCRKSSRKSHDRFPISSSTAASRHSRPFAHTRSAATRSSNT